MIMIVEKVRNDRGQCDRTWDGGNAKEIVKNIRQCQVYTREMIEDTKEMKKYISEMTRGNWPVILLLTLGNRVSPNLFPYLNRNCKFFKKVL
jgi:hypothetical protein